ncbi:DNA primase [Paraconexibacter antarcticus]|uniref:DNA primase n=1 Tax=Paraconexibacter antarcticus TaxID=2949664 RepID=A0ABY5DPC7_9ACTN|nr:DNA primase [Paraconexibacter antarcticus]UTI62595.1 DNA primase [Paraconexibacter antarcticus]
MARYTADSKEKVKDAVDMLALVGQYSDLRKAGPVNYKGLCPFHDERTPSFNVNVDERFFKCFGCGEGGDALSFVQKKEGLDFIGALEYLAERFGVELELEDEDPVAARRRMQQARLTELLRRTADFYVRNLWESREAAHARAYLAERGLDEQLLREFRVGYAPRKWDAVLIPSRKAGYSEQELLDAGLVIRSQQGGRPYDRFRARITFPLCDRRGHVMGFGARRLADDDKGPKYLNSNDGPVFSKGKNVYASDIARVHATKAGTVILAEGYTDVIALHQAGLRNTVGLMGTSLTTDQVMELARLAPTVLLALDADSAGQEAMLRAARVAAGRKLSLRVIPLPTGMDPADLVQAQGPEKMRELAAASLPFVSFRVRRVLDTADLTTAEGKDAAIDELRPVFADIPPSALREELARLVADRTDLQPTLVASWLAGPARRAPAPGGGERRAAPVLPQRRATPVVAPPGAAPAPPRAAPAAQAPAAPARTVAPARTTPPPADGEGWEGMDLLEPDPDTLDPGTGEGPFGPAAPAVLPSSSGSTGAGAPGGPASPAPPAAAPPAPPPPAPAPSGPHARTERALLIQVVARPDIGRAALREIGGADAFTSDLHRRVVTLLLSHDGPPSAHLPADDPELASLMAGLVVRAGEQVSDAVTLEAEVLKLRLAMVERQMKQARANGSSEVPALARERQTLQQAYHAAMAKHMESDA